MGTIPAALCVKKIHSSLARLWGAVAALDVERFCPRKDVRRAIALRKGKSGSFLALETTCGSTNEKLFCGFDLN